MRPKISGASLTLASDDRAVRFFNNLTLTDDFAGQPFRLRPWQEDRIIRPIFGTLRPDGLQAIPSRLPLPPAEAGEDASRRRDRQLWASSAPGGTAKR
jgi:hypothetical protein